MKKVTLILVIVWGMAAYLSENVFSISVVVLWATIICAIPVFLFFEIYHWIKREKQISNPYLKGIIFSSITGFIVIFIILSKVHGEGGLAVIGYSPELLILFNITGLYIASIYEKRNRTFLR